MTTKVQSVTGNGATLTLNGVAAGNTLFVLDGYFRTVTTGLAEAVPTDTNGTFVAAIAPLPLIEGSSDSGGAIFYQENAASGTHTVTPQANSFHSTTLVEFSGLLTSSSIDVTKNASTANFAGTSQVTGTTSTTAQADELSLIALALTANIGNANVGLTDPVTNYLTLQLVQDDSTTVAVQHAYRILTATGTQSATFNWTDTEINQYASGMIATFKAVASSPDSNLSRSSVRGGRGPSAGPRQRRMVPQRFPDDIPLTVVPATVAPFHIGRGRAIGMPLRRMIPQRYADTIATTTTTISPPEGAITIAGAVASLTLTIAAVAGAIVIGGNAPSVTTTLAPSEAAVVISGNAPSITTTIAASTGAVTIGGNAPALTSTLAPSEAAVVISGNVPDIPGGPITPTEGAIVFSGNAPDVTTASLIVPVIPTTTGGAGQWITQLPRLPEKKRVVFQRNVENRDRHDIEDIMKILRDLL